MRKFIFIIGLFVALQSIAQNRMDLFADSARRLHLSSLSPEQQSKLYFNFLVAYIYQRSQTLNKHSLDSLQLLNDSITQADNIAAIKQALIPKLLAAGFIGDGSISDWVQLFQSRPDLFGQDEQISENTVKPYFDACIDKLYGFYLIALKIRSDLVN